MTENQHEIYSNKIVIKISYVREVTNHSKSHLIVIPEILHFPKKLHNSFQRGTSSKIFRKTFTAPYLDFKVSQSKSSPE